MTVAGKGGSPRQAHVPARLAVCAVHGSIEFRAHKIGFDRVGNQRFRYRCPKCHTERNNKR